MGLEGRAEPGGSGREARPRGDADRLRRQLARAKGELTRKDQRFARLAHDVDNLLAAVDVPVVVLDDESRVRLVTPIAGEILGIRRRDLGRHLDELGLPTTMPDLLPLVREVLDTGQTIERRLSATAGVAYVVRAAPYLGDGGQCEGCVLAFLDAERERRKTLEESQRMFAALSRIDTDINAMSDAYEILAHVVDTAGHAAGAACAALFRNDAGTWCVTHVHALPRDLIGHCYREEELPYLQSIVAPGLTIVEDDFGITDTATSLPKQQMLLALQVVVRGEVHGVLVWGFRESAPLNAAKLDFARRLARSISVALENASAYSAQRRVSDALQESLLTLPEHVPGITHAALYRAADGEARVGGDFYDLYELPDGIVAIAVGDISGKGLDAATLTALARNVLRAHALEGDGPAEVVSKTNRLVHHFTPTETFLTAFFGLLDTRTGVLRYCSAGHPPALVTGKHRTTLLPGLDPMIGAFDDIGFAECTGMVGPGETLVVYTDGILEARTGKELYGEDRIVASASALHAEAPADLLTGMLQDVLRFADGKLRDDVAMMAVRLSARPPA